MKVIVQLIGVVLLNTLAQLSLKIGSPALSSFEEALSDPLVVLGSPHLLMGGGLYAISLLLYVNVLSQTRLSVAYPFLSLTYVFVVVGSVALLNETVRIPTILGIALIVVGVTIVGLTFGS